MTEYKLLAKIDEGRLVDGGGFCVFRLGLKGLVQGQEASLTGLVSAQQEHEVAAAFAWSAQRPGEVHLL